MLDRLTNYVLFVHLLCVILVIFRFGLKFKAGFGFSSLHFMIFAYFTLLYGRDTAQVQLK